MANLLIADDNEKIASILERYAKKEGYTVTKAFNGESALGAFFENQFDMILLDVMMPKKMVLKFVVKFVKRLKFPLL